MLGKYKRGVQVLMVLVTVGSDSRWLLPSSQSLPPSEMTRFAL